MQVHSTYLGKSVELEVIVDKNGNNMIKHDSLMDLVHEQNGVKYAFDFISAEVDHSVVLCTMTESARKVTEIGESMPSTLKGDIARDYPSLTAFQRAFDRATIKFFGFKGKYFSDVELSDATLSSDISNEYEKINKEMSEAVNNQNIAATIQEAPVATGISVSQEAPVEKPVEQKEIAPINVSQEDKKEEVIPEAKPEEINSGNTDEVGLKILTLGLFGKVSPQITVKQAYESGNQEYIGMLKYMATKIRNHNNADVQAQVKDIIDYFDKIGFNYKG